MIERYIHFYHRLISYMYRSIINIQVKKDRGTYYTLMVYIINVSMEGVK